MGSSPGFQIQDSPNAMGFSALLASLKQPLDHGTQPAFINNAEVGERFCTPHLLPGLTGTPVYLRRVKTSSFHLSWPFKTQLGKPAGYRGTYQTLIEAIFKQLQRRCSI